MFRNDQSINYQMTQNRRILIVDDEPYNILGLSIVLQQSGYERIVQLIDKAYNGKEAVDLVKKAYKEKKHSYGLIFMDCSMPIMSGYEASLKIRSFIRQKHLHQPMIVACTGHVEKEYVSMCWDHQMDEVLSKPISV